MGPLAYIERLDFGHFDECPKLDKLYHNREEIKIPRAMQPRGILEICLKERSVFALKLCAD